MRWLSDERLAHLRDLAANPDFSATKYRLIKELARGGMGTVYLAEDTELERCVAIKLLSSSVLDDCERLQRFVKEAKAASALNHPNILTIYEIAHSDSIRFIGKVPGAHMAEIKGYRFSRSDAESAFYATHYFLDQYFSKIDQEITQYYTLTIDLSQSNDTNEGS